MRELIGSYGVSAENADIANAIDAVMEPIVELTAELLALGTPHKLLIAALSSALVSWGIAIHSEEEFTDMLHELLERLPQVYQDKREADKRPAYVDLTGIIPRGHA